MSRSDQHGAETFDPGSDFTAVRVTAAARAHLLRSLAEEQASAVRLGVTESGCNGYMYELTYASTIEPDDTEFAFDAGLVVVVRRADMPLVQGTEIDFVTEGLNSALRFKNPNADAHCGCGESFSVAG